MSSPLTSSSNRIKLFLYTFYTFSPFSPLHHLSYDPTVMAMTAETRIANSKAKTEPRTSLRRTRLPTPELKEAQEQDTLIPENKEKIVDTNKRKSKALRKMKEAVGLTNQAPVTWLAPPPLAPPSPLPPSPSPPSYTAPPGPTCMVPPPPGPTSMTPTPE